MTASSGLNRDASKTAVLRVDGAVPSPRAGQLDPSRSRRLRRRRLKIAAVLVCAVLLLVAAFVILRSNSAHADSEFVYATVQRSDLAITVTERGTIESQNNVDILCEVEDVPGDGINGTPILWIVDNGISVKKGDLLVELDAAPHQERLDSQVLST